MEHTLSNLRVCLSIVGCAAQSPMALTPSCYFGALLGCAVSRACVRWCRSQDEADEDARRCVRERTELISERVGLTNRIGAVLATLGVSDYNPLLRSRHRRLTELRTGLARQPRNARGQKEGCLRGWNWYSRRSLSWSVNVMRWWKRKRPTKLVVR